MIAVICILIRTYVCFVVVPRREIERNDNKTKPSKIFTIGVILTIIKRFVDFKEVLMKSTKEKTPFTFIFGDNYTVLYVRKSARFVFAQLC